MANLYRNFGLNTWKVYSSIWCKIIYSMSAILAQNPSVSLILFCWYSLGGTGIGMNEIN